MTWWAWLLQLAGLALLAFSLWLIVTRARRDRALKPWALLVALLGAIIAALLFVVLSPSKPPAAVLVPLILIGPVVGVGISLAARLELYGKALVSSQGQWYALVWCGFLFIASLLVIAGQTASDIAVAIAVFASLGTAGYVLTLYMRYAARVYNSA
jgi:hypothetical protein